MSFIPVYSYKCNHTYEQIWNITEWDARYTLKERFPGHHAMVDPVNLAALFFRSKNLEVCDDTYRVTVKADGVLVVGTEDRVVVHLNDFSAPIERRRPPEYSGNLWLTAAIAVTLEGYYCPTKELLPVSQSHPRRG